MCGQGSWKSRVKVQSTEWLATEDGYGGWLGLREWAWGARSARRTAGFWNVQESSVEGHHDNSVAETIPRDVGNRRALGRVLDAEALAGDGLDPLAVDQHALGARRDRGMRLRLGSHRRHGIVLSHMKARPAD